MKPHSQTELRRVALLLALATILVSPLPASSTPQAGHGKGKSTGSGCPGGLDVSRSGQPSVPLAIAVGVFTGQRKGLIAPDEIILSTRLRNAAWTTFYRLLSAPGVTDYITDETFEDKVLQRAVLMLLEGVWISSCSSDTPDLLPAGL